MIEWLIPIGLFWVVASVQFGGLIDAENGSGLQQFLGLILTFAVFLVLFWLLHLALGGLPWLPRVLLGNGIPLLALGWIGRIAFRLVGVRIVSARFGADAH
jgi:hypothetical protein